MNLLQTRIDILLCILFVPTHNILTRARSAVLIARAQVSPSHAGLIRRRTIIYWNIIYKSDQTLAALCTYMYIYILYVLRLYIYTSLIPI